jgi:hypothetical protein
LKLFVTTFSPLRLIQFTSMSHLLSIWFFYHHIPHCSEFLFFLKMLHLPNGYEILEACTHPTKVEDEPFPMA